MHRKPVSCSSCLQEGHMKNSERCILYRAKLNNIQNLITDELKAYILTMMENKQYKINEDDTIKQLLTDEDIKVKETMNEEDIIQYLNETKRKCDECGSSYMYPFVYKENNICEECNHIHIEKHTHLWKQIMDYCIRKGMINCSLCDKERNDYNRFHFDHINIFVKTDSVCNMVKDELDIECIKREIDKCQLLCIHCHYMVTRLEHKLGFIRMKKELPIKHLDKCKELYNTTMQPIYTILRKNMHTIMK